MCGQLERLCVANVMFDYEPEGSEAVPMHPSLQHLDVRGIYAGSGRSLSFADVR